MGIGGLSLGVAGGDKVLLKSVTHVLQDPDDGSGLGGVGTGEAGSFHLHQRFFDLLLGSLGEQVTGSVQSGLDALLQAHGLALGQEQTLSGGTSVEVGLVAGGVIGLVG